MNRRFSDEKVLKLVNIGAMAYTANVPAEKNYAGSDPAIKCMFYCVT